MNILQDKIVNIRKKQKCFGCTREFLPPSKLQLLVYVDSGDFSRSYWCDVCRAYWTKYMDSDDTINMGDLKQESPELWEPIRNQIEGLLNPEGRV